MNYIIKTFAGFAAITMVLAACSNVTSNDPNVVLQSFFKKLAEKDIDGASRYVTSDSKPTMEMMKKGLAMAERMKDSLPENDLMHDFEDVTFGPAKIAGDSAFIVVGSSNRQRPEATFRLLKQNDGWKVDFTMATLMRTGMKSVQEPDGIAGDTLNLKSEEAQKGMKMADSILKNMDPEVINKIQKQLEGLK